MEFQKINIEIDGIEKEAKILKILSINEKEYAIYSIDNENETSDIFSSEIIKDEDGYDKLIDIEEPKVKEKIFEIIEELFS